LDQVGRFDFAIGPIPMTLAELSVMATIAVWLVHAVSHRKPLIRWTPFTPGLLAILLTMIISLAAAAFVDVQRTFVAIVSVTLLAILVHIVDAIGTKENIRGVLRLLAIAMVGIMLFALLSASRIEDIYFD